MRHGSFMRLIKQRDDAGCGLACAAMVSGATYAAVRKTYRAITKTTRTDKVVATKLELLKEIMQRHGIAIEGRARKFGGRDPEELDLNCDALVKVNPRLEGEEWHWVVWDHRRNRVLDPKQPAYQRLKFVSYWRLRQTSRV